jgi:hypothetical protein
MANPDELAALKGSIEEAEAAMHKGRGKMLVGMIGAVVALLVGVVLLVGSGDDARVAGEIGKAINGIKQRQFDRFWGCALQGTNLKNVRSNAELASQIDVRSMEKGEAYAAYVRGKCLDMLDEIAPQLDTLIVPDDLKADVAALREAVGDLRSAWNGFITYLGNPDTEYASEDAKRYIDEIARGWFDFKKAHGAINATLKTKLE